MRTKVFENTFNGKPMFSVFEVNEDGEKIGKFNSNTGERMEAKPVVNMGIKKAALSLKHSKELAIFIEENK